MTEDPRAPPASAPAYASHATASLPLVDAPSGLRAAFRELDALEQKRLELLREKRSVLHEKAQWEKRRGEIWALGTAEEEYKRRLGRYEMRDETALVDQFALLTLHLDAEGDLVEEDVDVQDKILRDRRIWSYVMAGERVLVRRLIRPQERLVLGLLNRQRKFLGYTRTRLRNLRRRSPGLGWTASAAALAPLLLLRFLVKLQELLLLNVVKGQKAIADTAVALPVTVKTSVQASREELATAESRRRLRLSVFHLRLLTPERRQTVLFLAAVVLVASYLFSELFILFLFPDALGVKRTLDIVFFYAIGTRLILPTPFEPILLTALPVLGFAFLVLVAALGGVVGSWLLFLVGAQATAGLERVGKKRRRIQAALDWAQARGRRHGYWILFLALSIPFAPDALAALGGVFKLRLGLFLFVIFFSVVLRCTLFLYVFA